MRFPASTRQNMIYNNTLLFDALEKNGIALLNQSAPITPSDLALGYREKTLTLLWQLIFHWRIEFNVRAEDLQREIEWLKIDLMRRRRANCNDENASSGLDEDVWNNDEVLENLYFQSETLSLLFTWARLVCLAAGCRVRVLNFTSSFADGQALCSLISYYHPRLLPAAEIEGAGVEKQREVQIDIFNMQ